MEGHGRSFPITRLTFQVRKVIGGGVVVVGGGLQNYIVSLSPSPFPLDLGLGFGTGLTIVKYESCKMQLDCKAPQSQVRLECGQKRYRIVNLSAQAQRGEEGSGEHLPECCSTLGQCVGSPTRFYLRVGFRAKAHVVVIVFFIILTTTQTWQGSR